MYTFVQVHTIEQVSSGSQMTYSTFQLKPFSFHLNSKIELNFHLFVFLFVLIKAIYILKDEFIISLNIMMQEEDTV